eukprot:INCI10044.1.p1 GENE.INCI10044.1~~INCI10044.1.p1  ORF type:complete len:434 (-),score=73.66 INCI10044.1:870-2171(-)
MDDPVAFTLRTLHGLNVMRIVGHGGEGQVYSATDKDGQYVAIKCLNYGTGPRAFAETKKKVESESLGWTKIGYSTQILHLENCRVLAFVMPLLEGMSLKQHARIGIPWDRLQGSKMTVLFFEQLVLLHNRRLGMNPLAHRDIKPSNVMIVQRPVGRRARRERSSATRCTDDDSPAAVAGGGAAAAPEQCEFEFVPVIIDWGSAHVAKADGSQDRKFPGQATGSRGYFGPDIYKTRQTYNIDVYASIPIVLHFLRYHGDCSLLKSQIFDQMKRISVSTQDIVKQERRSELYERAARAPFPIVEVAFEFYRSDPEACRLLINFLARMQAQRGLDRPTSLQCLKFFLRLHEYFFLVDTRHGDGNDAKRATATGQCEVSNANSDVIDNDEYTAQIAGVLREMAIASGETPRSGNVVSAPASSADHPSHAAVGSDTSR